MFRVTWMVSAIFLKKWNHKLIKVNLTPVLTLPFDWFDLWWDWRACKKIVNHFSFWSIKINVSNKAPRGGWWGFGTEHIADISATICWKISISDKSVYILKLQYCQYHKVYFCPTSIVDVKLLFIKCDLWRTNLICCFWNMIFGEPT